MLNFYDFADIAIFRANTSLSFAPIKIETNFLELNQKRFFDRCSKCKHHRDTVHCLLCGHVVCSRYCAFNTNDKKDSSILVTQSETWRSTPSPATLAA